jgi:hypothetical protein
MKRLFALLVLAATVVHADEPKHIDYQHPPMGTWGVAWCGAHGILWVHDATGKWWRFSSEDGTSPPLDDERAIGFFNEWVQSGPTDIVQLKNVECKKP